MQRFTGRFNLMIIKNCVLSIFSSLLWLKYMYTCTCTCASFMCSVIEVMIVRLFTHWIGQPSTKCFIKWMPMTFLRQVSDQLILLVRMKINIHPSEKWCNTTLINYISLIMELYLSGYSGIMWKPGCLCIGTVYVWMLHWNLHKGWIGGNVRSFRNVAKLHQNFDNTSLFFRLIFIMLGIMWMPV